MITRNNLQLTQYTLVHLAKSSLVGEFTKFNVGFPLLRFVRAVRLGVFVYTRVPQHRVRQ